MTSDDPVLAELPWLRQLARRLAANDEAEDLLQDTWLMAQRDRPEARGSGGLRPWLTAAMRNRLRSIRRTSASRQRREDLAGEDLGGAASFGAAQRLAMEADVAKLLADALRSLSDDERALLRERFFAERTTVEIAEELEIPAATVRTRIRRSLHRLRTVLDKRHGTDRTRWAPALAAIPASKKTIGATMASAKGLAATGIVVGAVVLGLIWTSSSDDQAASAATDRTTIDGAESALRHSEAGASNDAVERTMSAHAGPAESPGSGSRPRTVMPRQVPAAALLPPAEMEAVVLRCTVAAHKHPDECDFLEPDDATLDRMADCGVVRYDFPAMFAKADDVPAFDDQWLQLVGATAAEREELIAIGDAFRDDLFAGLQALATEAELPPWPTDVTLLTAVVDLNRHYGDPAMRVASKRLAEERAGRVDSPTDLASRPPVDRFLRLFAPVGDRFEAAVAERLGPPRARELHFANDGWPGLKLQTGAAPECRI